MSARYQLRKFLPGTKPSAPPQRIRKRYLLATLLFVWVAVTLCILPRPVLVPSDLESGLIWTGETIVAPADLIVRDPDAEIQARREAQLRHSRVFRVLPEATQRTYARVQTFVQTVEDIQKGRIPDGETGAAEALNRATGVRLSSDNLSTILAESTVSLNRLMAMAVHSLLMDRGVTADRVLLDTARQSGNLVLLDPEDRHSSATVRNVLGWPTEAVHVLETRILADLGVSPDLAAALTDALADIIEPNVVYDSARSMEELALAIADIRVDKFIPAGSTLVRPGERLQESQVNALRAAGDIYRIRNLEHAVAAALIAALSLGLLVLYTRRYQGTMLAEPRTVLMLALPVVMAVSLGRVTHNLLGSDIGPAALPVGMVGMVATILFDARIALLLAVITPLLFAVGSTDFTLAIMVTGILTGAVGAFSLVRLRERWHVLLAGVYVAITCLVSTAAVGLLDDKHYTLYSLVVPAAINGLMCYGLTVMVLPFFELVFKASTAWSLLELTSGDHPLLNQLEREAPGTYEHSLNVAKLAEAACDEIGANALLARAGSYFHDIGKMMKARYFVENQETPEDRKLHKRLTPSMSALIIRDHVRQGIEMAHENKLPDRVVDFIAQHHGTSTIAYFLEQERRRLGPEDKLAEEVFRYPGPKPQSIEAGIVMIADGLDATAVAIFTGKNVDEDDITKLVRDTVARLFADGQFDECPITMEQLSRIQGAYVRALKSRFHRRIQYPGKPTPSRRGPETSAAAALVPESDETTTTEVPPSGVNQPEDRANSTSTQVPSPQTR